MKISKRPQEFLSTWSRNTACQPYIGIAAVSVCGHFAVFKHTGHKHPTDWSISSRCHTYHVAFDIRQRPPRAGELGGCNPELWRRTGLLRNADKAELANLLQTSFLFANGGTVKPDEKASAAVAVVKPAPKYAFIFEGPELAEGNVLIIAGNSFEEARKVAVVTVARGNYKKSGLKMISQVPLIKGGVVYHTPGVRWLET